MRRCGPTRTTWPISRAPSARPWSPRRRAGKGPAVAQRFGWDAVARNHLPVYARMHGRPMRREATCNA